MITDESAIQNPAWNVIMYSGPNDLDSSWLAMNIKTIVSAHNTVDMMSSHDFTLSAARAEDNIAEIWAAKRRARNG